MVVDLNSFPFTKDSDVVEVVDEQIFNDRLVKTLSGDDSITSEIRSESSEVSIAINNKGTIWTGRGDDSFSGDLTGGLGSVVISNEGTIWTGRGDDSLNGLGFGFAVGILNRGIISTGKGNDSLRGRSSVVAGILNRGIISTGKGNDSLSGSTIEGSAILNYGVISTGKGNDDVRGSAKERGILNWGVINTGKGDDSVSGTAFGNGIENWGLIQTGKGDDSISVSGINLNNNGTIDMGSGHDLIQPSGLTGEGFITLGTGNDLIEGIRREGFVNQIVDGGKGFDTVQFNLGVDEVQVSTIADNSLVLDYSENLTERKITFTNVESFEFRDVSLSFDELKLSTVTNLDFDEGNLAAGTMVTDQFEGINVSTDSEFGVMIFDTNNPTGGDDDLAANRGNVLIISEDGDSRDPDDNAAGGTISIEFDKLSTVTGIELLDIDEPGSSISLFADDSSLIEVIEIPALPDGNIQELNLNVQNVARLDINLARSGALTELNYFESMGNSETFDSSSDLI